MKKFTAILLGLFMLLSSFQAVFAAEDTTVEISFKVGDQVLKINGTDTRVDAVPYVENGVTLVPVRVITEAFGAVLDWEDATQKITLTYQDVSIVLHIGDAYAYVNSQKQELLYAPQLIESVTMVPLRFVTENFGADVQYNAESEEITIVKSSGDSAPVSDITDILKKSDKAVVGDSYYHWSIKRTSEMELEFRSFDGRRNTFTFGENAVLYIGVYENGEDDGIDQIKAKEMETARKYTLVGQSVQKTASGSEYVKTQYKDKKSFADHRVYPYQDKIYTAEIYIEDASEAGKSEKYTAIADSFDLSFAAANTEDLSEVKDGMRLFDQKDFKVSFRLPADWRDLSDENTLNKFYFAGYDKEDKFIGGVDLLVYSKLDSTTVKEWAGHDLTRNARQSNPELYKHSELMEMPLGEQTASYYSCDRTDSNGTYFGKDIFWEYEGYYYNLHIEAKKSNEKLLDTILQTLKYDKIDSSKVGILSLDLSETDEDAVVSTKKNTQNMFTVSIPSSWTANSDDTAFYDSKKGIQVAVFKANGVVGKSDVQEVANEVKKSDDSTITKTVASISADRLSSSSLTGFEFEYKKKDNGRTLYVNQVIISSKKASYVITAVYPEDFYSEATRETVAKIIKSFTIN